MAKSISFINQKGGTGKTTICINLGVALAHQNKRVLVVDMDFQCNATTGLGLDRDKIQFSTFDIISNADIQIKDAVQNTYLDNLKIIPASFNLKNVNRLIENDPEKNIALYNNLKEISGEYDYILIDNPPSISSMTFNSLFASDYIYIPIEMSYFSLEGIGHVENLIELLTNMTTSSYHELEKAVGSGKIHYYPKVIKIGGIILNKWNPVNKIDREILSILEQNYPDYVFQTKIMEDTIIKEAIAEGIGVLDYDPDCRGSEDLKNLAREVESRESAR